MKKETYLALFLLVLLAVTPVQAATTTLYVISSVKENGVLRWTQESGSYTTKVTYTRQGLIQKIKSQAPMSATYTFQYDSLSRLKKFTEYLKEGREPGKNISKYTYKKGVLSKQASQYSRGDKVTNTYEYQNGLRVSSKQISSWVDEEGQTHTEESQIKAAYQKGHVIGIEHVGFYHLHYTLDKNGNYSGYTMVLASGETLKDSYMRITLRL